MKTQLEELRSIIKSHVKDLSVKEALKNAIIDNLAQEIMTFIQDNFGKKVAKHGQATYMTPEASQSIDDMRLKKGKVRKPGSV